MNSVIFPITVEIPVADVVETVRMRAVEAVNGESEKILEVVRKRCRAMIADDLEIVIQQEVTRLVRDAVNDAISRETIKRAVRAALKQTIEDEVKRSIAAR